MGRDDQKKVLIVDDDNFLLDMYATKFREAGFSVSIAPSGADAFGVLEKEAYDAILLDVVMPAPDGFEVLSKIKREKLAPDSLVIVLSNLGQKEDVDRGMGLGADDYIIKAHKTPREVVEKVEFLLSKKKS